MHITLAGQHRQPEATQTSSILSFSFNFLILSYFHHLSMGIEIYIYIDGEFSGSCLRKMGWEDEE